MNVQCLIVDDEIELAEMTREYFEMFGVSCACCASAQECLDFLKGHTAGLILLDINLVEESGFSLCKKIRETSDIPILFVSARDSDSDVLIALNIGGDDYIKKPYSLSVLLAKVQVVLKRMEAARQHAAENLSVECAGKGAGDCAESDSSAGNGGRGECDAEACGNDGACGGNNGACGENDGACGGNDDGHDGNNVGHGGGACDGNGADKGGSMRLAEEKFCVYLRRGGQEKEIRLKAKEFALLKCLYEHRGTIVTKEKLFLSVWGDAFYSDGTLNVHIRRLREKLEEDPSDPKWIKTIWGTGYMLEG